MRPASYRRLLAGFWLASALATVSGPASAAPPPASFDCTNAKGVDERLICSDPLLRAADSNLAAAYRAARAAGASQAREAALRADEFSWILRRNSDCAITKYTIVNGGNRPGLADCLLDEYAERIGDLRQMKRQPDADPASISQPIRRSFMAATGPAAVPADTTLSTFQLPDGGQTAALAWQADGTLLISQTQDGGGETIFKWRAGTPPVPLFKTSKQTGFLTPSGQPIALPPGSLQATQTGGLITISNGAGATLQLGPVRTGRMPEPRFVTLGSPAGTIQVTPPIRIDSRFHLTASYAPFAAAFVVSPADEPARLDDVAKRRWSKTNCLTYWLVTPAGAAQPACMPFGPYDAAVPIPLLTKNAVYLVADGYGLYRIDHGAAQPVISGNFGAAAVAPDGCALALAVQNGAPPAGGGLQIGGDNTVTVLSVCKRAAILATDTTPAAP